ncbi:chemotaxis protein CheA [Halalkalicoccus tibetensis]|uniref:Chemotaxis protein CheA n=1 Tax=Halalkalicoccus tibetensis TaxID=175632 RepID=A0ABD5V0A0_9EURY
MTDDHTDAFLREADERITDLNNALLTFEANPDDGEAMDEIFRTAHTLKGNFGAMGFEAESRLAHALEDLLDELRGGRLEASPDVMDLAFDGVDGIEASVRAIEDGEGGEGATVDVDPTVEALRAAIENGGATGGDRAVESGSAPDEPPAVDPLSDDCGEDETVYRAAVEPREGEMAGVEAMLAAEAIAEAFEPVAFEPGIDEVDGPFSVSVVARTEEEVLAVLEGIERVASATVEAVETTESEPEANDGTPGKSEPEIRSVRVDVDRLDELHGMVEQLVTSRIKLRRAVEEGETTGAGDAIDELDKITTNLQNVVMDVRLIPLEKVVSNLPRLVRDLAREEDKRIDFSMDGEDVELDRTILSELSDPLMHILRNSIDHGIEPPGERSEAGKPETGTIELRATRDRDNVVIELEDDGRGLDREAIEAKAVETGIHTERELATLEASEVYELIFHPGFSTAEEVTDVSGRGVGMDVVHSTVERLDGRIDVESEPGAGTLVRLRLPVSVAIVNVLFVRVGAESFGVPIKAVDEIGRTDPVRTLNGQPVVDHDDELYPVVDLGDVLDVEGADGDGRMLVRIRNTERSIALRCDDVRRQEEVVVKPLEGVLSGTAGLGGTAVLGDGKIVPILDVRTLPS